MSYEEKILNSFIGEEETEDDIEEISNDLPEEDDDEEGIEDLDSGDDEGSVTF
jgi:hypothetical protein